MILDLQRLSYNILKRGLKEAHVLDIVDFRFILEKDIPATVKNAMKEAAKVKYLSDADMVLVFKVKTPATPPAPTDQTSVEQAPENPAPSTEQVSEGEEQAVENPDETKTKDKVVETVKRCFYIPETGDNAIETVSLEISGKPVYLMKFTFPE